jgi:putative RNA 2'-phosphotransferase
VSKKPRPISSAAKLVRTLAHALRHHPETHGIRLDGAGWADLDDLLKSLRQRDLRWRRLDCRDIEWFTHKDPARRFECRNGRIRALYGHTVPGVCTAVEESPPRTLYHATCTVALPSILCDGLRSMQRRYVHLTSDACYAAQVGSAKSPDWAILAVDALAAFEQGTPFLRANDHVWQAPFVPARFIQVVGKHCVAANSPKPLAIEGAS